MTCALGCVPTTLLLRDVEHDKANTHQQEALQTLDADLSFEERLRLGREAGVVLGFWKT